MSDQDKNPNDSLDENMSDSSERASSDDLGDRLERLGGEPARPSPRKNSSACKRPGRYILIRAVGYERRGAAARKPVFLCASVGLVLSLLTAWICPTGVARSQAPARIRRLRLCQVIASFDR